MNNIVLTKEKNKQSFSLQYSFSCIKIEKIIVSLKDPEWFNVMQKYQPYLFFEYSDNKTGSYSYPLILSSLISAMHMNPIFDFKGDDIIVIPFENQKNMTSLGTFITKLSIELKFHYWNLEEIKDFSLTIYYNETPGVQQV